MYKVGYFYHLASSYSRSDLVLCYVNGIFRFYLIEDQYKILPRQYWNMTHSYQLGGIFYPVLVRTSGDVVSEIVFIQDINVVDRNIQSEKKGLYIQVDRDVPELFLDGNSFSKFINDEKEKRLLKVLVDIVITKSEIKRLEEEANYISTHSSEHHKRNVINDFIKRVNSYDIESILSSLYVEVSESLCPKVGGDDRYYIDRKAELKDSNIVIDDYIKELIGIGEECIYEDSGYTSVYNLRNYAMSFIEEHPIGVYTDANLENEKNKIREKYSKEAHIAHLFYEQLSKQEIAKLNLDKKKISLSKLENILKSEYYHDKFLSCPCVFFDKFMNISSSNLGELYLINDYLLRLQQGKPILNVLFAGCLEVEKPNQYMIGSSFLTSRYIGKEKLVSAYYSKIDEIIKDLSQDYFVCIISGNAEGAERIALRYAKDNKYEYKIIGMNTIERKRTNDEYYNMVESADIIIITGYTSYYHTEKILTIAKELNKPVKQIIAN